MPVEPAGATRAAGEPAGEADPAGLAHVAAVSFLAARASPSGGFWIALAGGVALARAGERLGARRGYGASIAALLQSVAVIGPARLGVPLTQALSAPLLGRMNGHGHGLVTQVLACALIRTIQNALGTVFFIGIVTGLDAYAASYDETVARVLGLPTGQAAALGATVVALLAWSAFGSTVQVLVYRRGLRRWTGGSTPEASPATPEPAAGNVTEAAPATPEPAERAAILASRDPRPRTRRFDARAVTLAAALVFVLLLLSTSWWLIAAVAVWLALASVAAAPLDRDVLPAGLALAGVLALGGFAFSAVGGLGMDVALRRASRAGLLVLVATWLRAAAGSDGVRMVARRGLRRLRAVPSLEEAGRALDAIGASPRLAAAGRALFASLKPVRKRPLPVVDAVLAWVRLEAVRFRPAAAAGRMRMALGAGDAALIALAAIPAAALAIGG